MEYNNNIINQVFIEDEKINAYIDSLIGKVFAILGVYEDCSEMGSYDIFDSYIFRVICELRGFYRLTNSTSFLSLSSILKDLQSTVMEDCLKDVEDRCMTHKRVKSIIFHCISIIKKEKVV